MRDRRVLLWMGFRHVRAHAVRTLITLVGIAVGVAMLTTVTALNTGLLHAFQGMLARVTGGVHLVIGGGGQMVPEEALEGVVDVDGVKHAAGVVEFVATVPSLDARLLVLGVDFLSEAPFNRLQGSTPEDAQVIEDVFAFINSRENALVAEPFARRHGLRRGDRFEVIVPSGRATLRVDGIVKPAGAADAFGGAVAVVSVDVAQLLTGRPGMFSRIDIGLDDGLDVDAAAARIQRTLESRWVVQRPEVLGAMGSQVSGIFRRGLQMSSFVALLVSLSIIYNTVLISVLQRRREWGILRAMGATRAAVVRMVLVEASALGFLGGIVGVGLGIALARVTLAGAARTLSSMYLPIEAESADLPPAWILGAVLLGAVASALAALPPALQAARVAPVEALVPSVDALPMPRLRIAARVLGALGAGGLAAAALRLPLHGDLQLINAGLSAGAMFVATFLLTPLALVLLHRTGRSVVERAFGITGRLAVDNMVRTLRRGSANVGALAAAVLTVIALASYIQAFISSLQTWVKQTVVADLLVVSGDNPFGAGSSSIPARAVDEIRAVPGVEDAVGLRFANQPFGNAAIKIRATDVRRWLTHATLPVVEGAVDASSLADASAPRVVISEALAALHGVHAGDRMTIMAPLGPWTFTVAAVVVDYASPLGVITMHDAFYVEGWGDRSFNTVEVFTSRPTEDARIREAIMRAVGTRFALWTTSNAEYRSSIDTAVNGFFTLTRLLILLALLVAILGIINTLQADVLDRVREIGLLRAVGASRRQVERVIVLQAVFMTTAATLLGALVGVLVGAGMVEALMRAQTGWRLHFTVPWDALVLVMVAGPVVAAVAAGLPARRAARINVINALASE